MSFSLSQIKTWQVILEKGKIKLREKMNLGRAAAQNGKWNKAYEAYSTGDETVDNLIQSVICALKLYQVFFQVILRWRLVFLLKLWLHLKEKDLPV